MARGSIGITGSPLLAFCARLKRLQVASGLTQQALAGHVGLGKSQLSAILNGGIKRPPGWDVVRAVVRACLDHAGRTGRTLPDDLRNEQDWRRRYCDLEHDAEDPSGRPPTAERRSADARGSQGAQVNLGGFNLQANIFAPIVADAVPPTPPAAFKADLADLLARLDAAACHAYLPAYLPPGADVTQMARAVRLLGRVRRLREEDGDDVRQAKTAAGGAPGSSQDQLYALPAERDDRADDPPRPWEEVAVAHERLVVLADPGMGKSWLLRTETHRLAEAASGLLAQSEAADALIPIPVRADVLANSPGKTLAEAVSAYLLDEGLLAPRSRQPMQERIANGGVVLLIDALDEVPRDPSAPGAQTPRKRLEDLLRHWVGHCAGVARCVLTTRLAGYAGPPVPGAREAELLPFTADDASAAIEAWNFPPYAAERVGALLRDPAVAGMARIPLLLALICSLAAEMPPQQSLPTSRAGLYEDVVWRFLSASHRSADRGAPASAAGEIERQKLLQVLTHVAITFASTDRGWVDRMSYQELVAAIRGGGSALADLGGSAPAVLTRLAHQAGVLVPAGNPVVREPAYMFLHRTVAEYLVARHLCHIPHPERMRIVQEHRWFDPDWAEVIPILGGLLAAAHPGDAQDLMYSFLAQRRDPLHRAFHTALRILGESPGLDAQLTRGQTRQLGRRTTRLLASTATQAELLRTLAAAPRWPPAVTDALLARLSGNNRHAQRAAIEALAGRDDPAVTGGLLALLADRRSSVRRAAVKALAGRDDPAVTGGLLALLADRRSSVRRAAVKALAGRDERAVTEALLTMVTDQDVDVRLEAVRSLAGREERAVTEALLTMVTDQDEYVRSAVTSSLAGREERRVTEALLTMLTDERRLTRMMAGQALAGRNDPAVTDALLALVGDEHWYVREAAAGVLADRDEPRTTSALLALLRDEEPVVRQAAVESLAGRSDPAVSDAVLTLATDAHWYVRRAVAQALADWDEPRMTSALLALLRDEEPVVRRAAVAALARRDEPAVAGALLAWIAAEDGHPDTRSETSVMAGGDEPAMTDALLHLLRDDDRAVREATVECLTGRDSPAVTGALLARLDDEDRYVREAAVDALARRDDPAVTGALLALLTDRRGAFARRVVKVVKALVRQDWAGLLAWLGDWTDVSVRIAAIKALAGRDGRHVTSALLAQLGSASQQLENAAAEGLAGRDDPAILTWLCSRNFWALHTNQRTTAFRLASRTADRLYPMLPPEKRPWVRRRLYQLTQSVPGRHL